MKCCNLRVPVSGRRERVYARASPFPHRSSVDTHKDGKGRSLLATRHSDGPGRHYAVIWIWMKLPEPMSISWSQSAQHAQRSVNTAVITELSYWIQFNVSFWDSFNWRKRPTFNDYLHRPLFSHRHFNKQVWRNILGISSAYCLSTETINIFYNASGKLSWSCRYSWFPGSVSSRSSI